MEETKDRKGANTLALAKTRPERKSGSPSCPTTNTRSNKPAQPLFKDDLAAGQRAKRRRTTPQDHAVLEAAYLKNSKPDKHERVQIVSQVHLGEKEVQIWFQNRRQNDRRRSKPLDAYELIPPEAPTPPISSDHFKSDQDDVEGSRISANHHAHPSPSVSKPGPQASPRRSPDASTSLESLSASGILQGTPVLSTPPSSMEANNSAGVAEQEPVPASSSTPGSGRKRAHAEMSGNDRAALLVAAVPTKSEDPEPRDPKPKESLQRSSSVRLSMTAEGAVKIRTNDETTPSPTKERPLPPTRGQNSQMKMRRSISLFEETDTQPITQPSKPRLLNAGFGRSRDARTWEFYCDSSARDALSTHVEAERNGSAVGAINLIRSYSHKSRGFPAPMSPSLSKSNAQLGTVKPKSGKPKIMRAKSSLARLQSSEQETSMLKQSNKQVQHVRSPSGDSDKENWAPGTRISENPLRRTQPTNNRRPVLQSNESATFRDVRPQSNTAGKASAIKTSAGGDDLDCIQGLLSLSQGAWR